MTAFSAPRRLPLLFCLLLPLAGAAPALAQPAPAQPAASALPDTAQLEELRARVEDLRRRAERIEDSNDIKRLQRSFGYYFDEGMWDEMADLFSADAVLEYARDGVYEGRERIRTYFLALGSARDGLAEGQLNEHFQLMPVITLAEDGLSAQGRWRDLSLQGRLGEYAWWGEGPYENRYVKEDGVWKISRMQWFQTMLVPYADGGWGRNPDVNQGIHVAPRLPPDAPPTTDYGSWPQTFLPPFHFPNPVERYQPPAARAAAGEQP